MQSNEGKLAERIIDALDTRGFSVDMLAHFLVQDPAAQPQLHELVTRLIEKWTDSHNSGMFHGAADRDVYAKAAALSRGTGERKTDPKNYRLPSEDIWDDDADRI